MVLNEPLKNDWTFRYEFSTMIKDARKIFVIIVETYWNQVKWELDYYTLSNLNFPDEIVAQLNKNYKLPKYLDAKSSSKFLDIIQMDFPKSNIVKPKIIKSNENAKESSPVTDCHNVNELRRKRTVKDAIERNSNRETSLDARKSCC